MTAPTHRYLSLGAGVQSSTLLLLAAQGRVPLSARANAEGHPLRGQFFLHRQRVPLDEVVLRPRLRLADAPGCGPWTCPHEALAAVDAEHKGVA
ncbi:hypothetical protein GA0070618_2152 [Micromonospora echinospora]|uniref:Uncharacterized protein n=1 Tax=Micromonospora echinospora TaxID=1877 RepID=A0A1C4WFQ5_MICEC|nr:hypothetical protein [Micromonospora echinospora]SCE95055.1 hypothetical protein GA0070618_2152 [Micromonospora echinospora]